MNYAIPILSMLAIVLVLVASSVNSVNAQNMSGNETGGNMSAVANMTNATVAGITTDTDNIAPSTPLIPN